MRPKHITPFAFIAAIVWFCGLSYLLYPVGDMGAAAIFFPTMLFMGIALTCFFMSRTLEEIALDQEEMAKKKKSAPN